MTESTFKIYRQGEPPLTKAEHALLMHCGTQLQWWGNFWRQLEPADPYPWRCVVCKVDFALYNLRELEARPPPYLRWDAPISAPTFNHTRGDSALTPCVCCRFKQGLQDMQEVVRELECAEVTEVFDQMFLRSLRVTLEQYFNTPGVLERFVR